MSSFAYDRERLIALLENRANALRTGSFTLASGRVRITTWTAAKSLSRRTGRVLIGSGIFERLEEAAGRGGGRGPDDGRRPDRGRDAGRGRRAWPHEPPGVPRAAGGRGAHGLRGLVEGPLEASSRVVIVDDVATTGGSSLQAVDAVEALGCTVARVIVVLDRLEGAAAAFAARGLDFQALLTIRDLGVEPLK